MLLTAILTAKRVILSFLWRWGVPLKISMNRFVLDNHTLFLSSCCVNTWCPLSNIVRKQLDLPPLQMCRDNTVLYFMNISSRKRLKVASRHSPVFLLDKRGASISKKPGEGNSFE